MFTFLLIFLILNQTCIAFIIRGKIKQEEITCYFPAYFHSFLVGSTFHNTYLVVDLQYGVKILAKTPLPSWLCDGDTGKCGLGPDWGWCIPTWEPEQQCPARVPYLTGPELEGSGSCRSQGSSLIALFYIYSLFLIMSVLLRSVSIINNSLVYLFSTFYVVNTFLCTRSAINKAKSSFLGSGGYESKTKAQGNIHVWWWMLWRKSNARMRHSGIFGWGWEGR